MKDIKEYIKPILIIVFATVISINLGFKKTLSLAQSYNNNKATLETIDQIPKKLSSVQYDIQKLDSLLNSTDTLNKYPKTKILKFAEDEIEKLDLNILELSEPFINFADGYEERYEKLILRGDYFDLLKFINKYERSNKRPKIQSVRLYSKYDRRKKETLLYSDIYYKTVLKSEENE
jgi:hypothetical protein